MRKYLSRAEGTVIIVINNFQDLRVWQKAHGLVILVYGFTKRFPADEKFGLSSQMRRAGVSIASNITEGFKRKSNRMSLNFYNIADGSIEELKYQLLLSRDLGYITDSEYKNSISLSEEVSKMLHGWVKHIR